jgi:hypothetical protein
MAAKVSQPASAGDANRASAYRMMVSENIRPASRDRIVAASSSGRSAMPSRAR